jgi:hypothetical protein
MRPVSGCGACAFTPELRQLHPSSVARIPSTLPAVGPQRRRQRDVPSGSVRPHYRCFGLTPLAAGYRARRLKVGRSVTFRPSWRGSKLNKRSSTHRRPRQPTSPVLICFRVTGGLSLQTQHCRPPIISSCRPLFWNTLHATEHINCAGAACLSS